MRILISLEIPNLQPWNNYSAVAAVVRSIAKILHEQGNDVYINEHTYSEIVDALAAKGADMAGAGKGKTIYRMFPKRLREFVKDIITFKDLKRHLSLIKNNPRPDIIISWISYGSINGYKLSKFWNTKLIAIFDNPINEEYHYQFGFYSFFRSKIDKCERTMLKKASAIIVYSTAVSNYIKTKHNINAIFFYKAFIDFNAMNSQSVKRSYEVISFGYIGSFFNWHKVQDLVNAFNLVRRKGLNCKLLLIGDGPEYQNIFNLVNESPYKADILLPGRKSTTELKSLISGIHVGIIPNALWFHAPLKLFQYASLGLAVISFDTKTIKELISHNKGYLFFSNIEELAVRMESLIANVDLLIQNSNSVRKFVEENYNENSYTDFLNQIIAS